jgi:hypothetical protein
VTTPVPSNLSFNASKSYILLFKIVHIKVSYHLKCGRLLNLTVSFSLNSVSLIIIVVVFSIIIRKQLFVSDIFFCIPCTGKQLLPIEN